MRTKIFVSKSLDEKSPLLKFCEQQDWEVIDRSLIYFEEVPFVVKKPFDLVFISSIRAFDYFMEGFHGDPQQLKFAVVGRSTADQMKVENSQIEYLVENSGETLESSSNFKIWVGNRNVLFPVSQISNNTYSDLLEEHQKESVVCYNTLSYPTEIDQCDFYVFTSPSNVKSFLIKNSFPEQSRVIAWGNTTSEYLLKKGVKPLAKLVTSTEEELVEILRSF